MKSNLRPIRGIVYACFFSQSFDNKKKTCSKFNPKQIPHVGIVDSQSYPFVPYAIYEFCFLHGDYVV